MPFKGWSGIGCAGCVPASSSARWSAGSSPTPEASAAALAGSDRKLLQARLAATDPDVVERGIQWLQEWHAEAAEERRIRRNRAATQRGRRRRPTGGDSGAAETGAATVSQARRLCGGTRAP